MEGRKLAGDNQAPKHPGTLLFGRITWGQVPTAGQALGAESLSLRRGQGHDVWLIPVSSAPGSGPGLQVSLGESQNDLLNTLIRTHDPIALNPKLTLLPQEAIRPPGWGVLGPDKG